MGKWGGGGESGAGAGGDRIVLRNDERRKMER